MEAQLVVSEGDSVWVDLTEYTFRGEIATAKMLGSPARELPARAARARIAMAALAVCERTGNVKPEVVARWRVWVTKNMVNIKSNRKLKRK